MRSSSNGSGGRMSNGSSGVGGAASSTPSASIRACAFATSGTTIVSRCSRLVYVSEVPDWLHSRDHIEQRSLRKGEMEQNILVEWADEAYLDESAMTFDPDYASDTGLSARTIGWSDSAGFLITLITVRDNDGHLWGATAFRANSMDERHYLDS